MMWPGNKLSTYTYNGAGQRPCWWIPTEAGSPTAMIRSVGSSSWTTPKRPHHLRLRRGRSPNQRPPRQCHTHELHLRQCRSNNHRLSTVTHQAQCSLASSTAMTRPAIAPTSWSSQRPGHLDLRRRQPAVDRRTAPAAIPMSGRWSTTRLESHGLPGRHLGQHLQLRRGRPAHHLGRRYREQLPMPTMPTAIWQVETFQADTELPTPGTTRTG